MISASRPSFLRLRSSSVFSRNSTDRPALLTIVTNARKDCTRHTTRAQGSSYMRVELGRARIVFMY